jgi:hypothetical protein
MLWINELDCLLPTCVNSLVPSGAYFSYDVALLTNVRLGQNYLAGICSSLFVQCLQSHHLGSSVCPSQAFLVLHL